MIGGYIERRIERGEGVLGWHKGRIYERSSLPISDRCRSMRRVYLGVRRLRGGGAGEATGCCGLPLLLPSFVVSFVVSFSGSLRCAFVIRIPFCPVFTTSIGCGCVSCLSVITDSDLSSCNCSRG